jgi:hypothetical protein
MFYRWFFPLLRLAFIAVWIAMAPGGKAVAERESAYRGSRTTGRWRSPSIYSLLAAPRVPIAVLDHRFAPLSLWLVRLGAALTLAGVAFALDADVDCGQLELGRYAQARP